MSDTRQINLRMDAVQQSKMIERVGLQEFYRAIGYLSTWNMTFPTVGVYTDINSDGDTDMVAVYKDDTGKTGYVIGAVWHEDHYGFHS